MTESNEDHPVRWLTVTEVVDRLGISSHATYDRIDEGSLCAHNFGGRRSVLFWAESPKGHSLRALPAIGDPLSTHQPEGMRAANVVAHIGLGDPRRV